jgi:hypothetical protein
MKYLLVLTILVLSAVVSAQEKTNDEISRQIRLLGVDHVTLTFDQASNTTKIMAVSENFSDGDANAAGIQAMNFAMAFFYSGASLKQSPDTVHLAFWVLTKKPRFAENHHLTVDIDGRTVDLGDARYAAKPNQNLEYLNFEVKRTHLTAIGSATRATFHIGTCAFSATQPQLKLISTIADLGNIR